MSNWSDTRSWNDELKTLKSNIKESEKKKDDLVEAARAKISEEEARELILETAQAVVVRAVRRLSAAAAA